MLNTNDSAMVDDAKLLIEKLAVDRRVIQVGYGFPKYRVYLRPNAFFDLTEKKKNGGYMYRAMFGIIPKNQETVEDLEREMKKLFKGMEVRESEKFYKKMIEVELETPKEEEIKAFYETVRNFLARADSLLNSRY